MIKVFQIVLTYIYGISFIYIGIQHYLNPVWFESIVPNFIGFPSFWVYLSGLFEIILGFLVMIPYTRKFAGVSLSLLLIILYIANINMWVYDISIGDNKLTLLEHFLRGAFQLLLIIGAFFLSNIHLGNSIKKIYKTKTKMVAQQPTQVSTNH